MVQMEAEDPSYPMPEGSVDGIFGNGNFGKFFYVFSLHVLHGAGHLYLYHRADSGFESISAYDPSVYHLKVSVTNAQDGSGLTAMVALRSEDADEKLAEGNVYKPIRHIARSTRFQPAQDW